MQNTFDWIRRSRSGAELIATVKLLSNPSHKQKFEQQFAAPRTALNGPCLRCFIFARATGTKSYCPICSAILHKAHKIAHISPSTVAIWGCLNQLPRQLTPEESFVNIGLRGQYVHDEQRFLLLLPRQKLKNCLQQFVLYNSFAIRGLMQIFPTVSSFGPFNMGELLNWAIHHEAYLAADRWHIRFFPSAFQVINPLRWERNALITFEISEFISLLDMAAVFRALLYPDQQRQLRQILQMDDPKEKQFYWGRFLGMVDQGTKDMLDGWKIRQWPKSRINLLYDLTDYVVLPQSR